MIFERTRGVVWGVVNDGDFWSLPSIRLVFGPLGINTADLDGHGWVATFRQKRPYGCATRPYVTFAPARDVNSGFRLRLPRAEYYGWHGVFNAIRGVRRGAISFNARAELVAPVAVSLPAEPVPIEVALAEHNTRALAALEGWRPERRELPDNVVELEDFIAALRLYEAA